MDGNRFDALTKSLVSRRSRRAAIAAGAAALVATVGLSDDARAAKCRALDEICRKDGDCCAGLCGNADGTGRRRCACPAGSQPCNGACCRRSCFVAGTRVAMADGTSKPIGLVELGDLVLGYDGAVNRVIGVERPTLGTRKLYGLNGGEPFVTAEHPFLTADGWKSIDPSATAAEQPALQVGRLAAGDSLVELAELLVPALVAGPGTVEVRTRRLPLRSVTSATGQPETVVYNLLLDGDHTYFANELLVHNKA
jgi:hypothetical protein